MRRLNIFCCFCVVLCCSSSLWFFYCFSCLYYPLLVFHVLVIFYSCSLKYLQMKKEIKKNEKKRPKRFKRKKEHDFKKPEVMQ